VRVDRDVATDQLLSEQLCFDLYVASRTVTGLYRPLLEDLGLTYPQYLVMLLLWERGRATVGQVVEAVRLDYSTVSPLLQRLQERGLATRTRGTTDERSVEIGLTPAGRELQERARAVPAVVRQALGLDDDELAELRRVLRALTESAADARPGGDPARRTTAPPSRRPS